MKVSAIAAVAALAAVAVAGPVRPSGDKYLIELGPGKTQWVTKDQKHKMRAVRCPIVLVTEKQEAILANVPRLDKPSLISPMKLALTSSRPSQWLPTTPNRLPTPPWFRP